MGFDSVALDADAAESITEAQADVPTQALSVRPNKANEGIEGMHQLLTALPRGSTESSGIFGRHERNVSAPFAFEIRYAPPPARPSNERVLSLQYVSRDETVDSLLGRHLPDIYSESIIERRPATLVTPEPGQHLAAATLGLRRYTLYPINNIELGGFTRDPIGSVLREMVGAGEAAAHDADVSVQLLARPATHDWQDGVPGGQGVGPEYGMELSGSEDRVRRPLSTAQLRHVLTDDTYERRPLLPTKIGWLLAQLSPLFRDDLVHKPSKADKEAARMLSDLDGRGWELHARIVAVSDDPDLAARRVASTAQMFDHYYEYRGRQTFVPIPRTGDDALNTATAAARREWPDDPPQRIIKPQVEVAGLTNVPKAEHVNTNKLRWALAKPGDGIPPGTPRFDYSSVDVDAATASRTETQIAMLSTADDENPLWYGTGEKHGTEAGVFQDSLYHQFVGGATRQGKTTLLTNFAAQTFRGSGGGVVIDPKGMDAEEFLAEWPADKPVDDLVVMDLSDGVDRVPRFNFLEIPDYLEPGTRSHASYVEALAEDILAMVAEAGGSDNYLGALMKRTVKAVVRGLGKSGQTATLLDVAVVCASSDNLSRFKDQMADERFAFLRDTAERLEERDDTDLEPLAGRLDEFVLNDNVRELICARNSSFSINDLVSEGRWLVVRFDKASSETEVKMVGTALIRRTYFAQRHLDATNSFDLICDEFDKIASETSNIHSILSEAAAFGYRCTLACQAPTNQLPDRVRESISNQCGTFLSFNPGGGKDARWISTQHTVDAEDLLNLSRFKFYMRATTRDEELTHSFKVEGFPPAREARGDPRTDAEIQYLIEQSLDRYGAAVETEAEQRAASPFIDGGAVPEELDVTDAVERAAVQAVFDATVRSESEGEGVSVADAAPVVRRRLARLEETPDDIADRLNSSGDVWRRVLQHIRDEWLAVETAEGETRVRARNPRQTIATVGENQSAGGSDHAMLMWDAYRGLTWAGLDIDITAASGTDPDCLARRAPDDEQHAPNVVDQLLGDHDEARIEAEHSTGTTKPGATVRHIQQADDEGRSAIVLCRPDAEAAIRETIHTPPSLCRTGHDVAGEVRYYTSPRDLRIDGEVITRPGTRENVWIREDNGDGDIVLRDSANIEYARFEGREAVFSLSDPYPSGGENTVKRPVIPTVDTDHITTVVVPDGAASLEQLRIGSRPPVPEKCKPLWTLLVNEIGVGDEVTKLRASELADTHDLGISQATVYRHMAALEDAGCLTECGKGKNGATLFSLN